MKTILGLCASALLVVAAQPASAEIVDMKFSGLYYSPVFGLYDATNFTAEFEFAYPSGFPYRTAAVDQETWVLPDPGILKAVIDYSANSQRGASEVNLADPAVYHEIAINLNREDTVDGTVDLDVFIPTVVSNDSFTDFEILYEPGAPTSIDSPISYSTAAPVGGGQDIDYDGSLEYVVTDFSITNPVSAAPEPASWMLMIGGLGLVGAAMRRRKGLACAVRL